MHCQSSLMVRHWSRSQSNLIGKVLVLKTRGSKGSCRFKSCLWRQFHRDDSMKKWTDYFTPDELEEFENMKLPENLDDPVSHWWGMA